MEQTREHGSVLAAAEKRLLVRIARALPSWISSDQLTVLALAGMATAGAGYVLMRWDPRAVWIPVFGLLVNWFGDSLDGTVARVRGTERPRYGFYVDHVVDIVGATFLLGGLGASQVMSPTFALVLLVSYLLVSAEVFLATAVHRVFRLSFAGMGPTELRILLATGTVLLSRTRITGGPLAGWLPFDIGGAGAIVGLAAVLIISAARNIAALRRLEPLPPSGRSSSRPSAPPAAPSFSSVSGAGRTELKLGAAPTDRAKARCCRRSDRAFDRAKARCHGRLSMA